MTQVPVCGLYARLKSEATGAEHETPAFAYRPEAGP